MKKITTEEDVFKIIQSDLQNQAKIAAFLHLYGNKIAEREGYKKNKGMEAIYFYLVQKHHWMPAQVRALNWSDLRFLLSEEKEFLTVLGKSLN